MGRKKGDCQAAALYLGALVHVITDAAFYAHVLDDVHYEKEFSRMIIETADVLIVTLDLEGNVIFFNKKAEEITGYSRSEIMGEDLFEIFFPGGDRTEFSRRIKEFMEAEKFSQINNKIVLSANI